MKYEWGSEHKFEIVNFCSIWHSFDANGEGTFAILPGEVSAWNANVIVMEISRERWMINWVGVPWMVLKLILNLHFILVADRNFETNASVPVIF